MPFPVNPMNVLFFSLNLVSLPSIYFGGVSRNSKKKVRGNKKKTKKEKEKEGGRGFRTLEKGCYPIHILSASMGKQISEPEVPVFHHATTFQCLVKNG